MSKATNKAHLLLSALVLGVALAGCERADEAPNAGTARDVPRTTPERRADAPTTPADRRDRSVGERAADQVSDATITAEVKSALAADPKLSAMKIDVDTDKGVVTLTGPAPDEQSKARATQIASASKGVVRVENRLEVRSS
jgi:hyperosmotically inducible protein